MVHFVLLQASKPSHFTTYKLLTVICCNSSFNHSAFPHVSNHHIGDVRGGFAVHASATFASVPAPTVNMLVSPAHAKAAPHSPIRESTGQGQLTPLLTTATPKMELYHMRIRDALIKPNNVERVRSAMGNHRELKPHTCCKYGWLIGWFMTEYLTQTSMTVYSQH